VDTSDRANSKLLPGVLTAEVVPSSGEDKRVTLVAYEEPDGGIDGDIIDSGRTNPGQNKKNPEDVPIYNHMMKLNQETNFGYFIESPPVAHLFAECEWRDWINLDYPNKRRTGIEGELRARAFGDQSLFKTVCGDIPENALYVDAVSVEDRTPWYEIKEGSRKYETFKLTPFYGYACNDKNMPDAEKPYCQDMKVRFCCAKKMRAEWSRWGPWEECNVSCGGGKQKRERACNIKKPNQETCYGMHEKDKERFTKQERECNVEDCPVPYSWTLWSPWSGCSITCGKNGRQTRERHCYPPSGGGEQCPDREKDHLLYKQEERCDNEKCETFDYGQWSAWSQMSETCGKGKVTRVRKCFSTTTKKIVENRKCLPPGVHEERNTFRDERTDKLRDCPVDGGWTKWQEWGACSQNCIHAASERGSDGTNKAIQKRYKFCSKPIPFGLGKKCPFPEGKNYKKEGKSLVEERECKGKDDGGDLPFCKVNCVYSSWSEWCPCSQTCIPRKVHRFKPEDEELARDNPSLIEIIEEDAALEEMPVRRRRMCKIKPEAHGGECPQEFENIGTFHDKEDQPFIEQVEQCVLADVHCLDHKNNKHPGDKFKWPEVPYPGDDRKTVGYCPVDCEWQPARTDNDCQRQIEREFNGTDSCYHLTALDGLTSDETMDVMAEVAARMKDKELYGYKDDVDDPKSLQKRLGACKGGGGSRRRRRRRRGKSRACRKALELVNAFKQDIVNLYWLTTTVTIREAKLPNLDGLYGGKACVREDGLELTKYEDSDVDKKYFGVEDEKIVLGACDVQLCPPIIDEVSQQGSTEKNCISMWTEWSPFGKCDKDCGDYGNRKRTRKCVCACDETKEKDDCRPAFKSFTNTTVGKEDFVPCSPCPPDRTARWSRWGDWKSDGYACSNEKGAEATYTRKRQCIAGPTFEKCSPGKNGKTEGWDEEIQKMPKPLCKDNPES